MQTFEQFNQTDTNSRQSFEQFKEELQHKKNMLKRIQGGQQSAPFTLGAEERSHGEVASQQRSDRHTGSQSKSSYSPATAAGMIHGSGEAMSHRTTREADSGQGPSLGFKAGPNALRTLNKADLESKQRSEAYLQPSSASRNQLNTIPHDTVEAYYQRSKNQHQQKSRNDLKGVSTENKNTENEDRIQMQMSPPRQNFQISRENTLGSQKHNTNQYQYQQPLEIQAQRSFPLRQPSVSPSPVLSGNGSRSRSRSGTPIQNGHLEHIPHNVHQSKDSLNIFHVNMLHGREPTADQDSTHEQEISSINVRPHQMTATEQSDAKLLNDDSQYIFTSQQNSVIDEDHDKFVFNTNALKSIDKANDDQYKFLDNDLRDERPQTLGDEGELSEPQIRSQQNHQSKQNTDSHDFRTQIQNLVRNEVAPPLAQQDTQVSRHHTGGSFGNLKDLQNRQGSHTSNSNSFQNLERMLEAKSHKVTGDADTNPNSRYGTNTGMVEYQDESGTRRQGFSQQKVRIRLSGDEEEAADSSVDFRRRKYEIRSEKGQSRKQSSKQRSRSNTAPDERIRRDEKRVDKKAQHRKRSASSRKRTLSSSNDRRAHKKPSATHDTRLSSESQSDSHNENTSQLSLSQKSRGSYGKYFIRSRKQMRGEDAERSHSDTRPAQKQKRGERREKSKSVSKSKDHGDARKGAQSRSKSTRSQKLKKNTRQSSTGGVSKSKKSTRNQSKRRSCNNSIQSRSRSATRVLSTVKRSQLVGRPPVPTSNTLTTLAATQKENVLSNLNTITHHSQTLGHRTPKTMSTIQPKKKSVNRDPEPSKEDATLAQNLLLDLAKKYRNMEKSGTGTAGSAHATAQRAQMVNEIQSLASALIKSEKRIVKLKIDHKAQQKKLKLIVTEQEDCINLLQAKMKKLDQRNQKLQSNEERAHFEQEKEGQKRQYDKQELLQHIDELQKRLQKETQKFDQEKREIIINMERDLQSNLQQQEKKHEMKLNSLSAVNDQLNMRLQDYQEMERDQEKLQRDYQQSLQVLAEFQEHHQEYQHQEASLSKQLAHVSNQHEETEAQRQEEVQELNRNMMQMQANHEQMLQTLQQTHNCEMQKNKLHLGQLEDSQKFKFEVAINNLQLSLKQREQELEEVGSANEQLKTQVTAERNRFRTQEQNLVRQKTELEEQTERLEQEAGELESRIQQMQRRMQLQENEYEGMKLRGIDKEMSSQQTQRSESEKDNVINELRLKLSQHLNTIKEQQTNVDSQNQQVKLLKESNQLKCQSYETRINQQQEEIQILAQGFQAQQAKLNAEPTIKTSGEHEYDLNESSQSLRALKQFKTGSASNTGGQSTSSVPDQQLDIKQDVDDTHQHLLNHQDVMNIKSNSESANDDFDEEYGTENNDLEDESQESSQRQALLRQALENTDSVSSTDRQLQQISPNKQRQVKMPDMRISSHTFGHQAQEQKFDGENFESAESPAGSQYDEKVAPPRGSLPNNLLAQKDEEISILWNVISKLKHKTNVTDGEFASLAVPNDLIARKRAIIGSYGNSSSIMKINGEHQHSIGSYSNDFGQIEETLEENDTINMSTNEKNLSQTDQEYGSTPVVVRSNEYEIGTDGDGSSQKELIDVKKRISLLMGQPHSLSSVLTSDAGAHNTQQSRFSSKTDSNSIGQYDLMRSAKQNQ